MNITLIHWNLFRDLQPIYRVQPVMKIQPTKEKPRRGQSEAVGLTIDIYA